jgi:hypothetical protein
MTKEIGVSYKDLKRYSGKSKIRLPQKIYGKRDGIFITENSCSCIAKVYSTKHQTTILKNSSNKQKFPMKKIILFFSLIMILAGSLSAQNVSFKMKRPPLNQLKAADLWSATIINTGETFSAYLYGSMTNNENGELIATGQTMQFEVKRGTTNFKVSDLPGIPDINYLAKDPKYKESFMNTGGAPPGDYKICVELRYTNNTVAGDDCFDQKIMGGEAPQLISPRDEEELRNDNPVFTWMHMKAPGSIQTYKIRIVEIKGNESPDNAILKNKAFFEKEGISQQLLQYPSSALKFEEGKKYAWQVSIGDLKSEIKSFTLTKKQPDRKGNCEENCLTNSIILNTGYNRLNNTVNASGVSDELWVLVGTPNTNISVPRIPTVISPHSAWVTQTNSAWISPYPTNSLNTNNPAPDPFYMYEACFCLCENSTVNLELSIAADDAFQFYLDDSLISSKGSPAFINPTVVNQTANLSAGKHCLRIGVRNLGGVAMGLNISGSITGASLLSQSCCNNKSKLTGMKFNDLDCDGIKDDNEPGLPGWTIQLNNGQSKVTDAGGFYTFTDLDAGNYIVTEVNQAGWTQTMPSAGSYNVNLASQQVVSNIDFGNCEMPSNMCDSFSVLAVSTATPIAEDCCWSLNLTHPANTSNINSIQILSLSPNTFVSGSSSLTNPSGWFTQVNNGTEFSVRKLGTGTIPPGQQNGFINFCLNKLSSPQHVVVNWRKDSIIVCSDTVTLNCDIPCVTFSNDTLLCNVNNYDLQYSFINNASYSIDKIEVSSVTPSNVTVTPSPLTLSTAVNPGGTVNVPAFSITGAVPDSTVCIKFKFSSPDGCCWCYDSLCVQIPSCVCNEVGATVTGDPLNCCYSLNLQNNFSGNYFTQVTLRTLEAGVTFSTWYTNTANNYYSTNNYPDNQIYIINDPANFPNSYIPLGNSANVLNFCLKGYTSTTQNVLVQWMKGDSVVCTDTVTVNCVPPPPETPCTQLINDSLTCLPDGTFLYTFHVKNNSSHTTTGFQLNPVTPGLVFTPANFSTVTIAPGMISPQQSMIISAVTPGSQFCFNISLYEHVLITGQQYYDWCCYSSEICKTAPNCTPPNQCKFEVIIDSVKCKQNAAGQWYYNVSTRIYNMTGSTATLNSVLVDNGTMNCTPVTLNTGMNNLNCSYTLSGTLTNPVCFTYRILRPGSADTCKFRVCQDITPCNPPPTDCDCKLGKWDAVNNIIKYSSDGLSTENKIKCNTTYTVDAGSVISINSMYNCNKPGCAAKYTYRINNGAMTSFQLSPYNPPAITSTTTITTYAWCGDRICDSCTIIVTPKPSGSDCKCNEKASFTMTDEKGKKREAACGETIIASYKMSYTFAPVNLCTPEDCLKGYTYEVFDLKSGSYVTGASVIGSGTFTVTLNSNAGYKIIIQYDCNGKKCECTIYIRTKDTDQECDCGGWADGEKGFTIHGFNGNPNSEIEEFVKCGNTYNSIYKGVSLDLVAQEYFCKPKDKCSASYTWKITSPSGVVSPFDTRTINGFIFNETGLYKVILVPSCGGKRCDECGSTIKVVKKGNDK